MAQSSEGSPLETTISVSWTQSGATEALVAVAHCNTLSVFRSSHDSYHTLLTSKAAGSEALRLCCWFSARSGDSEYPLLAVSSDSKKLFLVDPATSKGAGEFSFPFTTTAKKVSAMKSLPSDSARGLPSGLIVGDKFGDVYLYRTGSTTGTSPSFDWDRTAEPKFLLQHLSIISAVGLIPPPSSAPPLSAIGNHLDAAVSKKSSWRIVSCDKDDHIRVSRFPDTFYIDNYLWNPLPAAVTSLAVVESTPGEYILAVGTDEGSVGFWSIAPTGIASPTEGGQATTTLEKFLCSYTGAEGCGAVVGLDTVTGSGPSSFGVAFLKDPNVHFITVPGLTDGRIQSTQLSLRAPVVHFSGDALSTVGASRALSLDRSGALCWLTSGSCEKKSLPGSIPELCQEWGPASLEAVNVAAHWKEPVIDPRAKKGAKGNSDDEEAGEDGEDADGPSKKKQRN